MRVLNKSKSLVDMLYAMSNMARCGGAFAIQENTIIFPNWRIIMGKWPWYDMRGVIMFFLAYGKAKTCFTYPHAMCIACMRCHAWHVCMSCRMASSHRRASGHRCGCHHARVHASHGHEGEEQEGKKHGVTLFTWILSLRQALSPQKGPFWGPQEGGAIIPPFRGVLGAPFGGSPRGCAKPLFRNPTSPPLSPGGPWPGPPAWGAENRPS